VTTGPTVTPEATPDDVAALLTARTKDAAGRELGEWSDQTRPTADQVQAKIDIARSMIRTAYGAIPEGCMEGAETTVALLAAWLTEVGFWPEQSTQPQSTATQLWNLYLQARTGLQACVEGGALYGYELNIGMPACPVLPPDWWQRDLDNVIAAMDAGGVVGGP
jgi:hypothetical protein